MGNAGLKQHYETAKKTGVLKVSQKKMHEFPPGMKSLEGSLRTLDISDNKFTALPVEIACFINLKHLNLSKNKLQKLPDCIGALTRLEILNASQNLLASLPRTLSNLINLKQVHLSDNQLKDFPLMLCGLRHLDALDLSRNKIGSVPAEVAALHVTELNLNQNQVSELSPQVAACPRLRTLRLEENCLQLSAVHRRILVDSQVSTLALDGNLFEMKQLAEADGYDAYMERFTAVKKKLF